MHCEEQPGQHQEGVAPQDMAAQGRLCFPTIRGVVFFKGDDVSVHFSGPSYKFLRATASVQYFGYNY
jgi:hypothetical protein